MAEYESCFVYKPEDFENQTTSDRAPKRRKVSKPNTRVNQNKKDPFPPLLAGREDIEFTNIRYASFNLAWHRIETSLDTILTQHYTNTVNDIVSFVENAENGSAPRTLPTALIVGAPNISSQTGLTDAVARKLRTIEDVIVVGLTSTQLPNLKTALRYVNRQAASQIIDDAIEGSGRYLNYDLQMLQDHVRNYSIQNVVLYFHDTEGFQETMLSDLIDVFSSWNDRIPFILLFGIATSVDLFQEKLSQTTLRLLHGSEFEINQLDLETLFKAVTHLDHSSSLWLGAGLCRMALQRHRDHVQTSTDFIRTVKYLYMSHFFSDPLSVLTRVIEVGSAPELTLQHEHFQAIRTLPSFKRYAEQLLQENEFRAVRSLLDDDQALLELITLESVKTKKAFVELLNGVKSVEIMQSVLSNKKSITWSELYICAMSGELNESTLIRETLLAVKKLPSDKMEDMLGKLSNHIPAMKKIQNDLVKLISATSNQAVPLRSEHDLHHNTLRTTVVAQKVELSKQAAALSKQDIEYSAIVNRAITVLQEYYQEALINPQDLFLHELFLYDAKTSYRDAFTPRPRYAVERALSSPHDYLGCNCCDKPENGLSSTHPATALLYQLYLETGSQINVSDLWSAFNTIAGTEDGEAEEADQQRTLALFSRALAELKYFGMIKHSKKKADHIAKLSWKGL